MGKELYRMTITKCDRCEKEATIEKTIQIGFYSNGRASTKRVDLCANCLCEYFDTVGKQLHEYELLLCTKYMKTHE